VVETVLGIQFERLPGLTNAHLGAFWERTRSDWPHVSDAPPLDEQFETFGRQPAWNRAIHLRLTQAPAARLQMKNATGDRMVQLQNCRLDYNWIGLPDCEYPRYRIVRPEFDSVLGDFAALVADRGLGALVPTQWEVTYVNHMPKGSVWEGPEEWPLVFRSLPGLAAVPAGMRLEGFGGHWHFEIKPQRGRLHVELQHAFVGGAEKVEALVMKLTARGPVDAQERSIAAASECLDLGHDAIVTAFEQLTSERAHEYWNRQG